MKLVIAVLLVGTCVICTAMAAPGSPRSKRQESYRDCDEIGDDEYIYCCRQVEYDLSNCTTEYETKCTGRNENARCERKPVKRCAKRVLGVICT